MKLLHAAVIKGNQQRVSQLVQEGEDVDGRCECKLPDLKRAHEFTPLHCAAALGDLEVIDLLVKAGAQVDSEDEVGCSPLHRAVWYNKYDVVQSLLSKYDADRNKKNSEGYTPLHLAAKAGHLEILQLLLKAEVDLDVVDKVGRTATDHAKENGHLDAVKAMEEHSREQEAAAAGSDKIVRLTDRRLSGVPVDDLENTAEMEQLYLSRNRLKVLPSAFTSFVYLSKLYLDNNCLSAFPSELFALSEIEELSLADNDIDCLPEQIGMFSKMKTLLVFGNLLHSLPCTIGSLSLLESLDVHRNHLRELPGSFAQLQNLRELYLNQNHFEEVPAVVLEVGNSLRVLEVASNKLGYVPDAIDRLIMIERIDAGENKIKCLPETVCSLSKLQWLSVMDNSIQELPDKFGQLAVSLKYLSTTNNPLVQPPYEVCEQGIQAILKYQEELERCEALVLSNIKMVLLGSPLAGKTSLCNALMENKCRLTKMDDRTHCMDVKLWQADKELQFEVYDFGGHKVYDFVHQFFLSPLAMNVVTVDLKQYQPAKFEEMVGKWTKALNAHSPGAVIRMVGTHVDLCTPKEVQVKCADICHQLQCQGNKLARVIQEQMRIIKEVISDSSSIAADHPMYGVTRERMLKRYHKLRAMLETRPKLQWCVATVSSAHNLKGVAELRDELVSLARNRNVFPALRHVLPETWVSLETKLVAERERCSLWLEWEEVEMLGHEAGLSADRVQPAVAYLHKRGVVLHFHDIPGLKDVVFQNPARLTDILKLLCHHDISKMLGNLGSLQLDHIQQRQLKDDLLRSGLMSTDILHHLLKEVKHPPSNIDIVVKLLERFGICYPVPMSNAGSIARAYRAESSSMYRFTLFLPIEMPVDVVQQWSPVCPQELQQLTIVCVMREVTPWGLYERFCAQIDPHVGYRLDWANGILASFGDFPLHVTRNVSKENSLNITMATRFPMGDVDRAWVCLLNVLGELRSLLKEWPGLPYTFYIGCCHCLKQGYERRQIVHYFPGELLRQRRPLGIQGLRCPQSVASETVDTRLVYPPTITDSYSSAGTESFHCTNGGQSTHIYNMQGSSYIQIGTGNEMKVSKANRE